MLRVTVAREHVLLVHFVVAEKLVTEMLWGRDLLGPFHLDCVIDLGSRTLLSRRDGICPRSAHVSGARLIAAALAEAARARRS